LCPVCGVPDAACECVVINGVKQPGLWTWLLRQPGCSRAQSRLDVPIGDDLPF